MENSGQPNSYEQVDRIPPLELSATKDTVIKKGE